MKYKLTLKYILFYSSIIIILYFLLINWISYLFNNYILQSKKENKIKKEGYNNIREKIEYNNENLNSNTYNSTVHDIPMPLTTNYNCNNFCGPKGQCIYTGTQCLSDADCEGCNIDKPKSEKYKYTYKPYDEGGKLIYNQNPQYSELTNDIGTSAPYITEKSKDLEPPQMYYGLDKWTDKFNYGLALYNKKLTYRYSGEPEKFRYLPTYPVRQTATGMFFDSGPSAANSDIN